MVRCIFMKSLKGEEMKAFSNVVLMVFCLVLSAVYGGQKLHAADLYVLLVGDTHSQDIREASCNDLKNMHEEALRIAEYTHYTLKASFFSEGKNGIKLLKALNKLSPKKEDIVIFYYSGHGYRTSSHGTNPWPYLDFPSDHQGMSFQNVINHLSDLKPRLTILIADCCNWAIPYGISPPPLLKGHKPQPVSTERLKKNYQQLFCKKAGVIAIAGAQPSQASYCKAYGSFYTLSFLSGLHEVVQRSSDVNWKSVLSLTENNLKERLKPYNLTQQPVVWCNLN